ncbi:MAG: fused MFS/spermidine synthase [Hyphomicrobium sp.]
MDRQVVAWPAPDGAAGTATLALFTLTTFVSALLLFSVQPMFAKMVLPVLGGSPSVWAVALCFFQAALLVGYCYAHLLMRYVSPARTGLAHLAVSALAILALPIALPAFAAEPPAGDAYLWQLQVFAVAIGMPFVAVAANAPLLQAWFARTGHPQGGDPYFLYAASNTGSLLALLSYPLVLEPAFGLKALSIAWSFGFGVLIALLAVCFWVVRRSTAGPLAEGGVTSDTQATPHLLAPGLADRARWVLLSFVPAALLTAFTSHVATDVASAPLIWVLPLALYLLTFVIVFRDRALVPPRVLLATHLVAVTLCLLNLAQTKQETWYLSALLGTLAFFFSALVAHRSLYETRPAARHLTAFYLYMSLGGALGGLFASLLAPRIFSEVFEYPLLLALTFACRPNALRLSARGADLQKLGLVAAAAVLAIVGLPWAAAKLDFVFNGWGSTPVAALLLAGLLLALDRFPAGQLAAALALFVTLAVLPSSVHRGAAERSFFGVYRVVLSEEGQFNVLQHGTTLHGAQRIRDDDNRPVADTTPCTYYHPKGPMAQSVGRTRARLAEVGRKGRIGVVGLGAGSLACHSDAGETWRFYEIDPVVVGIAKSKHFTYLANCQPEADIMIGDARLTLAREADESFDLLVIDAFSSDAIPMHLLTVESLALYASKLNQDGVGVLHISNRYLDLEAVVSATLPMVAGVSAIAIDDPSVGLGYAVTPSTVVFFSKDQRAAQGFLRMRGARTMNWSGLAPWTDDTSDIIGPFLARLRRRG